MISLISYDGSDIDSVKSSTINQIGFGANLITIISTNRRDYPNLQACGIRMEMKFKKPEFFNIESWMHTAIRDMIEVVRVELDIQPGDRVGFSFNNDDNNYIEFGLSFRRFDQYNSSLILSALESVLQSNSKFLIDDKLVVKIDLVRMPVGGARVMNVGKSKDKYYELHRKSIYSPKLSAGDGNICLAVSIVIGMTVADGKSGINKYNFLTYAPNHTELINEALKLSREANVDLSHGGGYDEIVQFQNHLKEEYNLTVYSSRDGSNVYFKSPHANNKVINLLLDGNHYSVIKSLTAAFASAYFCAYCAH